MMNITNEHLTGAAVGLGTAALGYYLYRKNQQRIDEWLRKQGINMPQSATQNPSSMSLEELMAEKERLEDLIAEREMAPNQSGAPSTT